jgi:hypothetical protein
LIDCCSCAYAKSIKRLNFPKIKPSSTSSQVKLIEKRATKANEDWVIALESLYQSDHKNSGDRLIVLVKALP